MENYDLVQVQQFDDFNLKSDLLRGIYSYGFERPSSIQRKAILPILQGFDIIAQAQSGTGKSAAFILPVLQLIDEDIQDSQAIILAPTQDLASQLFYVLKCLAEFLSVSIHLCKKTTSQNDCEGFQILVGTPEDILNLLKLEHLGRSSLKVLVLDEADELIGGHHKEETKEIFGFLDENVQVAMFSTTMPDDTLEIAKKYTRKPVMILIPKEELMLDRISQYYVMIDEKETEKIEALVELIQGLYVTQMIIYCNENETASQVGEALLENDIVCLKIDNTMEFPEREKSMKKFRTGEIRILVTTNILSRGVDIQQVSLVLNYDLPTTKEEYLNRIGRCNRFSKRGHVINFATLEETQELNELEKFYCTKFELLKDLNDFY